MNAANRIALINIGLMIVSCAVAFVLPFELLLFSYAVLGPAHYLTEISWLHDRNYFTTSASDYRLLVLLTVLILLVPGKILSSTLILTAFAGAAIFAFMRNRSAKYLSLGVVAFSILVMRTLFGFGQELSIMLSTIIHVYLFTGAFILLGALRRKSVADTLALVVFALCPVLFFIFPPLTVFPEAGSALASNIGIFSRAG